MHTYSSTYSRLGITVLFDDIMTAGVLSKNPASVKLRRGKGHTNGATDGADRVLQTEEERKGPPRPRGSPTAPRWMAPQLPSAQLPAPRSRRSGRAEPLPCVAKRLSLVLN